MQLDKSHWDDLDLSTVAAKLCWLGLDSEALVYCYRCEQWCHTDGPWCALLRDMGLTSACEFEVINALADKIIEYRGSRFGAEHLDGDFDVRFQTP